MNRNEDDFLLLSGIQHFCFCRRQWALIHIEHLWSENALTAEGRVVHERVHDPALRESRKDVLTVRAMPIKSEQLGVTGECDAVIFTKAEFGAVLHGKRGQWSILPVEYKRGKKKTTECDRLQVAAQAMCLEEMFSCRIETGALYYFETRSRESVLLTAELREQVTSMFAEMHTYMKRGYTPKVKPHRGCANCSLRNLCLPTLLKSSKSAAAYIHAHLQEEPE